MKTPVNAVLRIFALLLLLFPQLVQAQPADDPSRRPVGEDLRFKSTTSHSKGIFSFTPSASGSYEWALYLDVAIRINGLPNRSVKAVRDGVDKAGMHAVDSSPGYIKMSEEVEETIVLKDLWPFTEYRMYLVYRSKDGSRTSHFPYYISFITPPAPRFGLESALSLSFAPNPAGDRLSLSLPCRGVLSIRDTKGQFVVERFLSADRHVLSLFGYPVGVYVLSLLCEEGVFTRRLLKR